MTRKQRRADKKRRPDASQARGVPVTPVYSPAVRDLFAEAMRHHQGGHLAEAERLYQHILRIDAHHADALNQLGVLAHQSGRNDIAGDLITRAIAANRQVPAFHSNLGLALHAQGKLEAAVASYGRALGQDPTLAQTHSNLGNALQDQGKLDEAVDAYGRALALKPDYAEAHNNLGNALQAQGKRKEALGAFVRALALKPGYAEAHNNLGKALLDEGDLDAAVGPYRNALALKPEYPEANHNLGIALQRQGHLAAAEATYRRAIAIKPNYADAHGDLGMLLLQSGRFAEGWPENEWRLDVASKAKEHRHFQVPRYQGEALDGRTILLHAAQGMGDTIQFCRYVPLVAAQGGRVLLEVQRPLIRLLSGLTGVAQIVAKGDPLPQFDVHCPLLSLPQVFDTRVETIPAPIPYLSAEADRVSIWRDRLAPPGLRVGIVWQGSPGYLGDRNRSIPLACFEPLARVPGVRLISLQKVHGLDQLERLPDGMAVETLGDEFDADAFLDTAAVLMTLDLVVTVDTAIGHLAGALDRPVWLPLTTVPHWMWMLDRDDSPWYPKTRLFRQKKPGDWQEVFERMADELRTIRRRVDPVGNVAIPNFLGGPMNRQQHWATMTKNTPEMHDTSSRDQEDVQAPSIRPENKMANPLSAFNRLGNTKYGPMLYNQNDIFVGRSLATYGEWSDREFEMFAQILKPGHVVVEAGANIGSHTVHLAQLVGDRGRIYAFEPQRIIFQTLCANLALNQCTNVFARQQGLGRREGEMVLEPFDPRGKGNFAGLSLRANGEGESVGIVTIDSLTLPRCDLIKIDVEGMEEEVITGAVATISRYRPYLYVENDDPDKASSLIGLLFSLRYRLWWHLPPLFNPTNFANNPTNIFGNIASINMVCQPAESAVPVSGLREVTHIDQRP